MQRLDGVEDETRRHALGGATEVAPRQEQDALGRGGECGEERTVIDVDPLGTQAQRAAGGAAVVVGEQRVVPDPRGEGALDQPADEDAVEIEAQPEGDRADQDAVAEATDPAEVGVELERERAPEHVEPGRGLDRVEAGEPFEGGLHLLRRLALVLGPARRAAGLRRGGGPPAAVPTRRGRANSAGRVALGELLLQLGDERAQVAGGVELVLVPLGPRVVVGGGELVGHQALERGDVPVE